jgi:ubiquinone/menaquinone biosynthesis C-methylase UbiE
VGVYATHVVPRLINVASGVGDLRAWRQRACEGLAGTVAEIGFGSAHNAALYPRDVTQLLAVEPSDLAWRLGASRIARAHCPISRVGLVGESVPLESRSCDAVLISFTLCTVVDPSVVLAEVRRLLKAGGTLHFLEHGRAPDPTVATWQRRLDGLQQRLFDGCHLTRDPREMLAAAGFAPDWSESRFLRGRQPWTYLTVGAARPAP